jgi:hypothetical protein
MPLVLTVGIPVLLALGMARRPRQERPAGLVLAATLGTALNRRALGNATVVHCAVLLGALFFGWLGYRLRDADSGQQRSLTVASLCVLGGFLVVWVVGLVW